MHGDGNGGNGNGADGARPTFEQALKELGRPRDRVDQLILFVAQQGHDLAGAIETQAHGLMQLFLKEMVDLAKMQAKTALVRTGLTPHNLPADCSNDRADECSTWTNSSRAAISIAK
jgi:hypothetical protein